MPRIGDIRLKADPNRRIAVLNAVLTPQITSPANTDPDEAERDALPERREIPDGFFRAEDVAVTGRNSLGIAAQNAQAFRLAVLGNHELRETVGPCANGGTDFRFELDGIELR